MARRQMLRRDPDPPPEPPGQARERTLIQSSDVTINGPHGPLSLRLYRPAQPQMRAAKPSPARGLVWAHGGAFMSGDLDMPEADWVARELAATGIFVVSVDYQLSPPLWGLNNSAQQTHTGEVRYPVASNEVQAAFEWASQNISTVDHWSLGGGSAGGNLAIGAALRMLHEGKPQPASLALAYPTLHTDMPQADEALQELRDQYPDVSQFGADQIVEMYENYLGRDVEQADVYAVPGMAAAEQLVGLPPVLLIASEVDTLRNSAERFAQQLSEARVPNSIWVESGAPHGHLSYPEETYAQNSVQFLARWINTTATAS